MANAVVYVDSGAGGANNGTSWANAYTTLAAAITASGTTGTDFHAKSTHAETLAVNTTYTFKGAKGTPDRLFSSGSTNSPPTTADLTFGAAWASNNGINITIVGYVYIYGAQITFGASGGTSTLTLGNNVAGDVWLDGCKLIHGATVAGFIICGGSNALSCRVSLINTTIKWGNANSIIKLNGSVFRWQDTTNAIDAAGTLPTILFDTTSGQAPTVALLDGVDLSALTNKAMVGAMVTGHTFRFANCKLPSGFTVSTPAQPGINYDFDNCDSGSTNYKQARFQYQGVLTLDTAIYNGASDGTTPASWKVTATANANPQSPFECFDIVKWVAAGTYAASKIYFTSATAGLKTNDVWVDVEYLGASYPLAGIVTTFGAAGSSRLPQIPQGTTPGSITTGAAWGTGGAGTNYSLDIPSFTTSVAGPVRFTVKVGKPSLVANIDYNAIAA